MVTEVNKANPVSGLRVCEKEECDSLGSIDDVEDDISEGIEKSTWCPCLAISPHNSIQVRFF